MSCRGEPVYPGHPLHHGARWNAQGRDDYGLSGLGGKRVVCPSIGYAHDKVTGPAQSGRVPRGVGQAEGVLGRGTTVVGYRCGDVGS